MSDKNTENELRLTNAELTRRVASLNEALLKKEGVAEALQDSEKRYRRLFESAKDGILILDADSGKVVDVNPFLLQLLDHTFEEVVGQHIWDLGAFKDVAASIDAFRTLQDSEYVRYDDLPLIARSGKSVAVEFVSNVYEVDHSKVIQCNIRDITGRKRADQALWDSRELLHGIFDSIPVRVFWKDRNLLYLGCNVAFARDAGFEKPEDIIGKDDYAMCWRAQAELYRADDRAVIESGEAKQLFEETQTTPSGNCIHLLTSKVPLRAKGGAIVGLLGTYYDISERTRAEEALAASDAKLRSILDNIDIGVALISPKMEILELNRRMREWFPAVDPSQRSICFRSFNHPPREAICEYCPTRKTLQDGLVHESETETPQVHGVRNYRVVSSPIRDASGEIVAAIEMVEDITEGRILESQLRQSQKMEAVGLLAGGIAHDYNNMLGVILGHTELAMKRVDPTELLHADLEEIFNAATRSADLTQQLLAFARKQTIKPVVLDLNKAVESMLRMLQRLIAEDIEVAWLPGVDLSPVMMDPAQLSQLLVNLCVNARDAIVGGGKITIQTRNVTLDETYCATHVGAEAGNYLLLAVGDDGSGMDKRILDQIFEPFFTTKGAGRGTGLGLSMVYGIVKQNHGFIDVDSEPGKGTTFSIYLPQCGGQVAGPAVEGDADLPMGSGETVLLVEDEPMLLTMGTMMLEQLGYRVLAAGRASEALQLGEDHGSEIRLLITDVMMPEMNGPELVERLRARHPNVPILFISGHTADVIAQNGVLNAGVNFLQKPFSMHDLAVKVLEAVRKGAGPSQGATVLATRTPP